MITKNRKRYPDWIYKPPRRRRPDEPVVVFHSMEEYDEWRKKNPWTLKQRYDRFRVVWWQFTHLVWLFDLLEKDEE